jgi:hypothetical protein
MTHIDVSKSRETVWWLKFWGKLMLATSLGLAMVFALVMTGIRVETLSTEVSYLRQWQEVDQVRIKTLELEVGELRKLISKR